MKVSSSVVIEVLAACFVLTAWVASESARQVGADVSQALTESSVPQKVAALDMGLSEAQLSEQLAARQPLNMFRLADLFARHPRTEAAYYAIRAERSGLLLIDRPELARIVRVASVIERAMRGKLRMARLSVVVSRKVSA